MGTPDKRKNKSEDDDATAAPVISKKRKRDLAWLKEGLESSEPFETVKRFTTAVEAFKSKESGASDIIKDFLQNGGTGTEFLKLLDEPKRKATEVALVFVSLEEIFQRMASDLTEYRDVGVTVASSVLKSYMDTVYKAMSASSNANQNKAALRMLTAMVTLGHLTAREVIVRIDFANESILHASQRKSLDDLPDVRSTFVMFITSFLMEEDAVLLRTIGENQAILWPVFFHLRTDTVGVIELFLTALRDKLVMGTLLSKTLKLHIFNSSNLVQLMRLFFWTGPQRPKRTDTSKNEAEVQPTENEGLEDDKATVAELLKSLLLSLTTSHKHGIAFPDYNLGMDSNTRNSLVFQMLQDMYDFWAGTSNRMIEIQTELVVKTIEKCPDLLDCYFRHISAELDNMRISPAWLNLCSLVEQIIGVQNLTVVFNPREKHTASQQAARAATLMGPCSLPRNFFSKGFAKENLAIRLAIGRIFQAVFSKINEFKTILYQNSKANMYSDSEKRDIFSAFTKKILVQVPQCSKLVEVCCNMPLSKSKEWYIDFWIVLLDLLASYAKLGWMAPEEQANFPLADIVGPILDCVNDDDDDAKKELSEQLKLSAFTFISSLSQFPKLTDDQLKTLVTQLVSCLVSTNLTELRLCASSLLLKIAQQGQSSELGLPSSELNIWISTLERYSEAASFFSQTYSALLVSPTTHKEEFESVFGSSKNDGDAEDPCSPLVPAAWKYFDEKEQVEPVASYITAVLCELLLCQKHPVETFIDVIQKVAPKKLLTRPGLQHFFKSLSGHKQAIDTSTLGLSLPATTLYTCSFPQVADFPSLKSKWNDAIVSIKDRPDVLQVVLYQTITSLSQASRRKADQSKILDLLRVVLDVEIDGPEYPLHLLLLQDSRVLDWFDLMNPRHPFIKEFNALVQTWLKLVQNQWLDQIYQRKLNDSITIAIKGDSLADISEEDLFLLVSELKVNDIEPQISALTQQMKSGSSQINLRYLNVFLHLAGRLRLEGAIQRISWSTFSQALRLFVSLDVPAVLQKGIYNVVSVCLEFLDSTDDFIQVLRSCLDSSFDYTPFCLLLVTSSTPLCKAFGQWCLEHEEHFNNVNWRLQILPAYLSSPKHDVKVLDMLHRNISPVLKKVLASRSDYQEVVGRVNKLEEFLHVLISKCWSPEECRDLAKLLSEQKKGLSCAQFVQVGRRGVHYDLHAKLCLQATVRQFKSENPQPTEIQQLAHEFDWLSKQTQVDQPALVKSILEDAIWPKFLKYTLRIGLRAIDPAESTLPPFALGVMTNLWRLLLAGPSDEMMTTSQKVYEMITSHSEFITVIMDERGVYEDQKKALLQLLTVLIQVNPKLCQGSQVPLLLSSYNATRSANDQLILGLLKTYEKNGVILSTYKPYLWGQAAAAHYSIQRGASTRLSQMPEAAEVLTLMNSQKLLKTAYYFPMELKLNGSEIVAESEEYDPRFILVSLAHILSSEYAIQCGRFTQSGAISLLFATLSSPCSDMRSLGWLTLGRLYDQLQNATAWPERCLWIHLIECVRNGAAEFFKERFGATRQAPPKISNIIALFLAKAAAIIRDPVHPMYRAINNFLVVKPALDVNQVPEFFVMLHSTELADQRKLNRSFLLNLLRDGIKSRQDYLVCARRRVFRILLSLQPCNLLADKSDKVQILEVVQSSLQNSIITYDLIQHRGLLMWLDSLLLSDSLSDDASLLLSLVETMWNTLYSHMQRKRSSLEKDDEEAMAKLEVEILEAEGEKKDATDPNKKPVAKINCRKPIWNLLPQQQQIIAPWIMVELIQLLTNLWRVLYHAEPNYVDFDKYTSVLCAAASHIHESKTLLAAAQKKGSKTVRFVAPPKMLTLKLMRQLVEVSSRFVSDLPDLRDHLATVETSKTKTCADPTEISRTWELRHSHMRKLMDQEEKNIATRCNLHMLLSLAECGV